MGSKKNGTAGWKLTYIENELKDEVISRGNIIVRSVVAKPNLSDKELIDGAIDFTAGETRDAKEDPDEPVKFDGTVKKYTKETVERAARFFNKSVCDYASEYADENTPETVKKMMEILESHKITAKSVAAVNVDGRFTRDKRRERIKTSLFIDRATGKGVAFIMIQGRMC